MPTRTLTVRTRTKTQWIGPAPSGRPGCALSFPARLSPDLVLLPSNDLREAGGVASLGTCKCVTPFVDILRVALTGVIVAGDTSLAAWGRRSGLPSPPAPARGKTDLVIDGNWTDAPRRVRRAAPCCRRARPSRGFALGAWLLVALCAPLAASGARAELADVLGADPMGAAQFASELLTQPHPLVAAGAGVWVAPAVTTPVMERWRAGLPPGVTTGDIPTQKGIDGWAKERTLGSSNASPFRWTPTSSVCWPRLWPRRSPGTSPST